MSCPKTLLKAVNAGRTRQVRLLLDLGASANDYDDCGQTPLMKGIFLEHDRNRDKIVKMLLKRGAIVSKSDVVGRNSLMWACIYGRDTEVSLLLEYADVDLDYNAVDINGQTALFHAVSSGNAATVKLLVQALNKYHLSVDIPNSRGVTPLMHATRLGHDVCASILIYEGHAKVGLGESNHEQFTRKEKWAISSLRERSKVKRKSNRCQSQFPPIGYSDGGTVGRGETRESKQKQSTRVCHAQTMESETELDSGTSTDDEIQLLQNHSLTDIYASDTAIGSNPIIKNCLQNVPQCRIPQCLLTPFSASASDFAASGDESEVDSIASTIMESKPALRPPVDLSAMFHYKQDQLCCSYRQAAVKEEGSELKSNNGADGPEGTEKNKDNDIRSKKWQQLKKGLRLTGVAKPGQLKTLAAPGPGHPDEGRPGVFPSLDKKVHLVQTASPRVEKRDPAVSRKRGVVDRNYSEM